MNGMRVAVFWTGISLPYNNHYTKRLSNKQKMKTFKIQLAMAALCGALPFTSVADLVVNGSFESNAGNGQLGFNTSATGWSVPAPANSYAFLFGPGTADTTGANGQYGNLELWGPNSGSPNGLPATSPDGGYFVALDSDFQPGALSQTISGLTAGNSYNLSFWWAGAQQAGFSGASTDQLQVSLGAQTLTTPVVNNAEHGFTGWQQATLSFTADSSSEVLSFLAVGAPAVPPFALLDGVSLTASAVPDNATIVVSAFVLLPVAGFAWRRFRKSAPAHA
jgi:hypothetical protein